MDDLQLLRKWESEGKPMGKDSTAGTENKINAMRDHILTECRRQKFTFNEFDWLLITLKSELGKRDTELHRNELF